MSDKKLSFYPLPISSMHQHHQAECSLDITGTTLQVYPNFFQCILALLYFVQLSACILSFLPAWLDSISNFLFRNVALHPICAIYEIQNNTRNVPLQQKLGFCTSSARLNHLRLVSMVLFFPLYQ